MRTMHFIAAALQFDDVLSQWGALSAATRERLIVFAAVGLVTVLVLVWVVFFRKSRRRQHGRHHSHHHAQEPAQDAVAAEDDGDPSQPRKRRKWRRLRRPHRPRNPTLSETGGLPPVRTGGPPEILP